jgi:heme A synthase
VVIVALGASVVADAIIAWGGYQMYRVNRKAKETAIDGMALLVIAQVVAAVAQLEFLGFPIVFLVSMLVFFAVALVFYYLTVISRFPDEAPAAGS